MDKKPTESEIKKALECCADGSGTGLIKATLDLINRLQAEKEKLKKAFQQCAWERDMLTEQNEYNCKLAKAEAYKEFAELLHCQCESIINQPHNENVRPISWKVAYEEFDEKVDNLLKELVGEENAKEKE